MVAPVAVFGYIQVVDRQCFLKEIIVLVRCRSGKDGIPTTSTNGPRFELIWSVGRLLRVWVFFVFLVISTNGYACHKEREKDGDHGNNNEVVMNVISLWRIGCS